MVTAARPGRTAPEKSRQGALARRDEYVDVVVVGSGAGAMTAAVRAHDQGLKVVVVEKTELYGGTSAVSGGGIWIPNNDHIARDGGSDSEDEALTYLRAATRGTVDENRLAAYVRAARRMLRYVEEYTPVRYRAVPFYADYYQSLPGAKPGLPHARPGALRCAQHRTRPVEDARDLANDADLRPHRHDDLRGRDLAGTPAGAGRRWRCESAAVTGSTCCGGCAASVIGA